MIKKAYTILIEERSITDARVSCDQTLYNKI